MSDVQVPASSMPLPIIPDWLDEYGFTKHEFRILARINRRMMESGVCNDSMESLSKYLQISSRSLRRAIRVLKKCNAIQVTSRQGEPIQMVALPESEWRPSQELSAIRTAISSASNEKIVDIYLIQDHDSGFTKIGYAQDAQKRLAKLRKQEPLLPTEHNFVLLYSRKAPQSTEQYLHSRYDAQRQRGEWFALLDEDVRDIITHLEDNNEESDERF